MIYRYGVWSETYTIRTSRGTWTYVPKLSSEDVAVFHWIWSVSSRYVSVPRSLLSDSAFDEVAYLHAELEEALAA